MCYVSLGDHLIDVRGASHERTRINLTSVDEPARFPVTIQVKQEGEVLGYLKVPLYKITRLGRLRQWFPLLPNRQEALYT